jgi:protein-S-isoprenylcysteine O-methyltransferase Ste14
MPLSISLSQASLAATILASAVGTYIALSPPNPSAKSIPSTSDSIRWLNLTNKHTTKVALAPLGLLALHTSSLTYLHPNIPSSILRHGAENGLNADLITWSATTSIPLALILCAGVPLRLVSYASLGKNFTFALTEPDRLTTTGIYRYLQHPSYTGLVVLIVCNVALLGRMDGVLSCWIPPQWYQVLRTLEWALAPVGLSVLMFGVWTRVRQEERMLRAEFGVEWERWHATTPRFIPWVF